MADHDYIYRLRPLVIPAAVFLCLYPIIFGLVHLFSKMPALEIRILAGIYAVTALAILFIWVVGRSKRVRINDRQIVFYSLLGTKVLKPQNIRRVAFYYDRKGQEVVQIRTEGAYYYLNECYFPFPELMADLEVFIQKYSLRYTLKSKAGYT